MDIKNISTIPNVISNQNQQKLGKNNYKNNDSFCRPNLYSLNFLGNCNKNLIDIPIQNNKEFYRVMRSVKYSKTKPNNILDLLNPFRDRVWIERNYKKKYPEYKKASQIEMGLIPYCGENDNSKVINMFLSGRLEEIPSLDYYVRTPKNDNSYFNVVRTLDYSLKKLDEEFGKYSGIVYRIGYMSEKGNQYFSTAKSLVFVKRKHPASYNFDPNVGYSVIRLKNGHKIYEFQNKMGSRFAKIEDEVLTNRHSKFRELLPEEMDEELLNAKVELAKNLFFGADEIMAGVKSDYYKYDRESLLKFVNVFEEISA